MVMNKVMNKVIAFSILFIQMLCVWAPAAALAKTGHVHIFQAGTDSAPAAISVVYCSDIAPFEFTNQQGDPDGLIIDFWKLWAKKTKIRVRFKPALWDETLDMVRNGRADVHAGLFYNKKRGRYLDYSTSLSKTTTHLFFNKIITFPDTFDQILAYRIGVIKNDYVEGYLKKCLPDAAIAEYNDYGSLIKDLQSGKLRVFAADTATGLYYLAENGIVSMFRFDNNSPLYSSKWYAAVKKGDKSMLDLVNSGMAAITPEERKIIERRWVSGKSSEVDGTIIIAVSSDYPPFSMINTNGEATGFLIDLWEQWAEIVGKPVKFKMTNWSDTLRGIKDGYADVHSGMFITDKRKAWLDFSIPLLKVDSAIYFKSKALHLSLDQMSGRKIGIVKDSSQESYIRKLYPEIRIVTYLHLYDIISALLDDRISAIVSEVPEMTGELQRMGLEGSISKGNTISSNTIHPAVLKKNKKLLYMVNHGFARMPEKTLLTLKQRWFPNENNLKGVLKWSVRFGILIIVFIFAGFLWNYKLRREIIYRREMAEALEKARKQAEKANHAKTVFLANMSHEIRTPMNAILGMNRLALETPLTDRQKYLLGNVQSASSHLLMLLNDILDFSKIEAGKLDIQYEPFSLQQLLETVFSSMNPQIVEKGLEFIIHEIKAENADISKCLVGDEFRIRQILYNLIGNSAKFTEKGTIELKVELSVQDENISNTNATDKVKNKGNKGKGNNRSNIDENIIAGKSVGSKEITALFSVSDSGIGIAPEDQELIFSDFQQADASIVRKFGGTGLGLTICRQLVNLLGGKIWVESTPKAGTTFFFTLKLGFSNKNISDELKDETADSANDIKGLRILMVEDNEINQELFKMILQKEGHRYSVADNGMSGLEKLAHQRFDMIFMDIQMPVMDGITACRIIRAVEKGEPVSKLINAQTVLPGNLISDLKNNLKGRYIPVVALTANAMGSDREECMRVGMDGYVTKPFIFEDIKKTIAKLVRDSLIDNGTGIDYSEIVTSITEEADMEKEVRISDSSEDGFGKDVYSENDSSENDILSSIKNHLSSVYNLNNDQIDNMVGNVKKTLSENLSSAALALENNDFEKLRISAHSIKGSLLNLGLNDAADKARTIEISVKEERDVDFSMLLSQLKEGIGALLET